MSDTKKESLVRHKFHSYHVSRETDHGILESGIWRGQRFITSVTGCGSSWEEAEAQLARGGSFSGYRTERP